MTYKNYFIYNFRGSIWFKIMQFMFENVNPVSISLVSRKVDHSYPSVYSYIKGMIDIKLVEKGITGFQLTPKGRKFFLYVSDNTRMP